MNAFIGHNDCLQILHSAIFTYAIYGHLAIIHICAFSRPKLEIELRDPNFKDVNVPVLKAVSNPGLVWKNSCDLDS